jgi:hypothetical protein
MRWVYPWDPEAETLFLFRVSSTLGHDVKSFGKHHMFDDNDETCWNSDQGSPQWILLDFCRRVAIAEIRITFQGGFAAKLLEIYVNDGQSNTFLGTFFPEDINSEQKFTLGTDQSSAMMMPQKTLKLTFPQSTDFYGRVIIYKLDVLGKDYS